MEGQRSAMYISFVVQTQAGVSLPGIPFFVIKESFLLRFVWIILQLLCLSMGRRTIVIETRGDICMSDRDNPRSLVEIMNDVLSTVREHYDSEYVYYIEKE